MREGEGRSKMTSRGGTCVCDLSSGGSGNVNDGREDLTRRGGWMWTHRVRECGGSLETGL